MAIQVKNDEFDKYTKFVKNIWRKDNIIIWKYQYIWNVNYFTCMVRNVRPSKKMLCLGICCKCININIFEKLASM